MDRQLIEQCKKKSILHYLISRGVDVVFSDKFWICSSPFARDTNWSFVIYPSNTFYCWSTGQYGDILDLVKYFERCPLDWAIDFVIRELGTLPEHNEERDFKVDVAHITRMEFDYRNYINRDENEVKAIYNYGRSRGIVDGFLPGYYHTCRYSADGTPEFVRQPALMFLHTDLNNNICGAKFRNIDPNDPRRFTARGDLGFYILDANIPAKGFKSTNIYICESETSTNSLWSWFQHGGKSARLICMGGVASVPREIPNSVGDYERYLIIDYDGNEELYKQRIKKYEHLRCKPIKMILSKGEDINSLYVKKEMWKIEHLLNNS